MPQMHAVRRDRAAAVAASLGADAVLITSGVNVRYLTGLVSSNAAVLIPAAGTAALATDSRYAGTAERECPDVALLVERDVAGALTGLAREGGLRAVAFEDLVMTVHAHRELTGGDAGQTGPELIAAGSAVDQLRMVKDEDEIELLAMACSITGQAFSAVLDRLRPGVTEREYAIALERTMIDLGADGLAFDSIVASGPNGAIPHHTPSDRQFEAGDLVTVDCGAQCGGYHADMTRTVALGKPATWQLEIYRACRRGPGGRRSRGTAWRGRDRPRRCRPRHDRSCWTWWAFRAWTRSWRRPGDPRGTDHLLRPDRYTTGSGSNHHRTRHLPARHGRSPD